MNRLKWRKNKEWFSAELLWDMNFAWRARAGDNSFEEGSKAEGSGCAQHRGWAGHAAPCAISPAGRASSTEMLNCFFLPFSHPCQPPILPLPSRTALLSASDVSSCKKAKAVMFFIALCNIPCRRGGGPDSGAAAFAWQRQSLKQEGHLHAAERVCPVLHSSREQRDPGSLESPCAHSRMQHLGFCCSKEANAARRLLAGFRGGGLNFGRGGWLRIWLNWRGQKGGLLLLGTIANHAGALQSTAESFPGKIPEGYFEFKLEGIKRRRCVLLWKMLRALELCPKSVSVCISEAGPLQACQHKNRLPNA